MWSFNFIFYWNVLTETLFSFSFLHKQLFIVLPVSPSKSLRTIYQSGGTRLLTQQILEQEQRSELSRTIDTGRYPCSLRMTFSIDWNIKEHNVLILNLSCHSQLWEDTISETDPRSSCEQESKNPFYQIQPQLKRLVISTLTSWSSRVSSTLWVSQVAYTQDHQEPFLHFWQTKTIWCQRK